MTDPRHPEGLAPTPSTFKEYSLEQIWDYFAYVCSLVEDGYDMNILTPEEFFANE